MISYAGNVSAGNAARILLTPPAAAVTWRLLRRAGADVSGPVDVSATVVYEGDEKSVLDAGVENGIDYGYMAVYLGPTGSVIGVSGPARVTPRSTFIDCSVDVLSLVRDRLQLGLASLIDRGGLLKAGARIPVLTAAPTVEWTEWPLVTVHVGSDASQERGIGEQMASDEFDGEAWDSFEGWLSRWQIQIIGWSKNSDERIKLRNAIKSVVIANMPVFDAAGMVLPDLQFSDQEDFHTYGFPVYQVTGAFSCMAPSAVSESSGPVSDVIVTLSTP